MKKFLTEPQKAVLYDIDKYIASLPENHSVKEIALNNKQFQQFELVTQKKRRFPEANSDVPLFGTRYRGFEIYESGKTRPSITKKAQGDFFHPLSSTGKKLTKP